MKSSQTIHFQVLLFLLFLSPGLAFPQAADNAALSGRITDQDGLPIVGVKLEAINTGTNIVYSGETNDTGLFYIPVIPPGAYRLTIEKEGFQRIVQTGIDLHVADSLAINFVLPVGSITQSITVLGDVVPLVNTSNGSLGALVDEHEMADLPLNGRNYEDLALLQPGTSQDYNLNNGTSGGGKAFSNNGATAWSNWFTLDGAPLNNALQYSSALSAGETFGIDGIREFKVVTIQDATYGMVMGGQIAMVSKGGTNTFHGDVFDYLRNSDLDARNFFDYGYLNDGPRLPHLERNNFGASFGGPIKKDKTFFYGTYEGLRQLQGITVLDTVPAANCHGPANAVIWNGTGTEPAGAIGPCPQLGANPGGAGTNSVRIWPAMAPLLALYPNPDLPNNQYTFPSTDPTSVDFGQMRVDHSFSTSDSMFARYTIANESYIETYTTSVGNAFPQFKQSLPSRDQFLTIAEDHIFSPTLLNTARLSGSRTTLDLLNIYPDGPFVGPEYSFTQGFPIGSLSVTPFPTMGPQKNKPSLNNLTIFTLSDDLFYTKGRHSLKFGMLINRFYQSANTNGTAAGSLAFGNGLASFLEGLPTQEQGLNPPPGQTVFGDPFGTAVNRYYGYDTIGFYGQDDWRATSRLTLNLGMRYEFMTIPVELNGNGYAIRNIATDSTGTAGPIMQNPTYHNFSPRLGFAYDLTGKGKTSIRGGFGIYYDIGNIGSELREQEQGTPPLTTTSTASNLTSPMTLPFIFTLAEVGKSLQTIDYDARSPHALEYNLTVEQQLFFGMKLSLSYVGSRGINLWTRGEGNPVIPTSISNGAPYYGPSVSACENVVPSCRVNPNWTGVIFDSNSGNSWYNALVVNVAKRLGRGLEFQGSYTFSRSLDDTEDMGGGELATGGCVTNPDTVSRTYAIGPSCFDATHKLALNLLYHFPTIQGNGFVRGIANGWWVGNIATVQSGNPLTPELSANRSRSGVEGTLGDYANINTAASIAATFPMTCTSLPGQPAAGSNPCLYTPIPYNPKAVITGNPSNWFNPAMFSLEPVGYLGDAARDMLRAPGVAEWDFSAVKDTPVRALGEKGIVEFRAEIFNIVNHPNLGIPLGTTFSGKTTDVGPYSELPLSNAGQITSTNTSSRQIQFALKLLF